MTSSASGTPLCDELLRHAVGWRCGPVAHAATLPISRSDPPLVHAGATSHPTAFVAAGGGVAESDEEALRAATAEVIERMAAATSSFDVAPRPSTPRGAQLRPLHTWTLHARRQRRHLPAVQRGAYRRDEFTLAHRLLDNRPVWVPTALVALDPQRSPLASSSGLAADGSPHRALLRATQELLERDAFMATWLHGLSPPRVGLPSALETVVRERGGDVEAFDLTPSFSPHPVAAVAGTLPLRGKPRNAIGLACRSTWEEALDKAWREWAQGVLFAGSAFRELSVGPLKPSDVTTFDLHALYYTVRPGEWSALPLWGGPRAVAPPPAPVTRTAGAELEQLAFALEQAGIEVLYRELTTLEAAMSGLRIVRALSPQLTPLHGNHRFPHLGGTTPDVARRYPWSATQPSRFPSPHPHPLG